MIQEILDKYRHSKRTATIYSDQFPALEKDIAAAMQKKAVAFAEWIRQSGYKQFARGSEWFDDRWPGNKIEQIYSTPELYTRFLFEQWAAEEGYGKAAGGWVSGFVEGLITETQLMEKFKKSV